MKAGPTTTSDVATRRSRAVVVVSLAAATLVGLAISLTKARSGTVDVWYDDAWVAIVTRLPGDSVLHINGAPGFTALARWWIGLRAGSLAWSQTLALLGYLGIAPAVYWAAIRTCGSRWAAAVVACVTILAPVLVTESSHIKQYTIECALSALMVGVAAGAARTRPTTRRTVGAAALTCVGTVFSGVLVLPAAVMIGILLLGELKAWRSGRRHGLGVRLTILGIAVVFVGVWVGAVLAQVSDGYNHTWRGYGAFLGSSGSVGSTTKQLLTLVRGFMGGFFAGGSLVFASSVVAAAAVVALVAYAIVRWRRVWWLMAAPAVALVASAAQKYPLGPVGYGRVDSWLFPWLIVLLAQVLVDGWALLEPRTRRVDPVVIWTMAGLAAVLLFVVLAVGSWAVVKRYPATRARSAAASLRDEGRTSTYVEQADMSVLLHTRGPVVLVRTTPHAALNGIIVRPSGRVGLLDTRPVGRASAIAELTKHCGGRVLVIGASARSIRPILDGLPCRAEEVRRDTRGTFTHWDDSTTITLGR